MPSGIVGINNWLLFEPNFFFLRDRSLYKHLNSYFLFSCYYDAAILEKSREDFQLLKQ